ncbi:PEP/pyruvate-binding domain-containing protein [Desulfolutivibrio sulfoxidireducens]|uniref:PEP/pyruvate-binding domain-containing protein n=1 Tax=Desulfolutivibrio sulfoxidireducens TaxID=2773299 RepID=UPI00159E7761|nr:PEP/pyruvate-binding domain-containing protein [Desulfolutivibrio sulfoxidireducens]QLA18662.1 pyruvate, phosphate dikinase [Desulfolutivibrio sulfoxidireducens]
MFNLFNLFRKSGILDGETPEKEAYRKKYHFFQSLLAGNNMALEIITDIEGVCYGEKPFTLETILDRTERLLKVVYDIAEDLNALSGGRYPGLFDSVERIGIGLLQELVRRKEIEPTAPIMSMESLSLENASETGGKAASLGEVKNRVHLPTPRGFAVTAYACYQFLRENRIFQQAGRFLRGLDIDDTGKLLELSEKARKLVLEAPLPAEVEAALVAEADKLVRDFGPNVRLAMRSSALSEDSESSFAGQHSSVLNVRPGDIVTAYKEVVASVFNPRAVYYRRSKGYPCDHVVMSALCLTMVDAAASGVMYTRDPNDTRKNIILINAVWGLGVGAVEGSSAADFYTVEKKTLSPLTVRVADKETRITLGGEGGLSTESVPEAFRRERCLPEEHITTLAGYGLRLERHYGRPLDIEWALDRKDRLVILQARPLGLDLMCEEEECTGEQTAPAGEVPGFPVLLRGGCTASRGKAAGAAFVVTSDHTLVNIPEGSILIAPQTSPRYVSLLGRVRAIVTDVGSVTGHMASVAREFGIPTLVGTGAGTTTIPHGAEITVDASHRVVYAGRVEQILERKKPVNPMKGSPIYKTARSALKKIAILNLVDPDREDFTPEHCRTLHDVIRFAHEMSMREMFHINEELGVDKSFALRVRAPLPMRILAVDLGGGFGPGCELECDMTDVVSVPFRALLLGMTHPNVHWVGAVGVDVKGFMNIVAESAMAGPDQDERMGGPNYAAVSKNYLNFNSRLGYHFATVDAYCGLNVNDNYITFSFKGGAADIGRRSRRAMLITAILKRLGLHTKLKGDMVTGTVAKYVSPVMEEKLDLIGRLLGSVRLLDMVLSDDGQIEWYVDEFFKGNYSFQRG